MLEDLIYKKLKSINLWSIYIFQIILLIMLSCKERILRSGKYFIYRTLNVEYENGSREKLQIGDDIAVTVQHGNKLEIEYGKVLFFIKKVQLKNKKLVKNKKVHVFIKWYYKAPSLKHIKEIPLNEKILLPSDHYDVINAYSIIFSKHISIESLPHKLYYYYDCVNDNLFTDYPKKYSSVRYFMLLKSKPHLLSRIK